MVAEKEESLKNLFDEMICTASLNVFIILQEFMLKK